MKKTHKPEPEDIPTRKWNRRFAWAEVDFDYLRDLAHFQPAKKKPPTKKSTELRAAREERVRWLEGPKPKNRRLAAKWSAERLEEKRKSEWLAKQQKEREERVRWLEGPKPKNRRLAAKWSAERLEEKWKSEWLAKQQKERKRWSTSQGSNTIRRLAVWYEYARESDEIVRAVQNSGDDYSFPEKLRTVYHSGELEFLASTAGFPFLSFRKVLDLELMGVYPSYDRVFITPLSEIDRERLRYGSETIQEYIEDFGSGKCLVAIPWDLSDPEIARQFEKQLPHARPDMFPEVRRPGRRGRFATLDGTEFLHQLSAFRTRQTKGKFVRGIANYTTQRGWNGAVRAAEVRIRALPTKHLFA